MGLILDTSVLIDSERAGNDVLFLMDAIRVQIGEVDLAISAVSLVEMAHGVARSRDERTRRSRETFLADLRSELTLYPLDASVAVRAGLLDGELRSKGISIGLADLLIGITALHFGHGILTRNVRHFKMIPGLDVVEL